MDNISTTKGNCKFAFMHMSANPSQVRPTWFFLGCTYPGPTIL